MILRAAAQHDLIDNFPAYRFKIIGNGQLQTGQSIIVRQVNIYAVGCQPVPDSNRNGPTHSGGVGYNFFHIRRGNGSVKNRLRFGVAQGAVTGQKGIKRQAGQVR